MADTDSVKEAKKFYEDVPMETPGFFLKGSGSLGWARDNKAMADWKGDGTIN